MDSRSASSRTWFRTHDELKAFDSLRAPVWVFDVDRHGMWWGNHSALTFWNVGSLSELLARDFSSDSEIVRQRLRQIVDNPRGPESSQETWTLYPLGKPTTVMMDFKPILIDDGRQAVLIEASHPIELDRDPEALRILEAARNTPLLVSTFAPDGRLLAQNPAATACYRREAQPGETSGSSLGDRFVDRAVVEKIQAAIDADAPLELDVEVRTANGQRYHRVAARRGRDPISGETAVVLTEEDITERVEFERDLERANRELNRRVEERTQDLVALNQKITEESERRAESEAALRDQFAFLQTLIDTVPTPIFYKDTAGRYLGFNKAFHLLVGSTNEEIVGKTVTETATGGNLELHERADRALLLEGRGVQTYEISTTDARGERRDVVIHKDATRRGDGSIAGIAGVIVDVTELKRTEAQLRDAQRLEAIGKLTGGVAHDFNNLLTVILGNLELIADMVDGDPEAESLTGAALRAVDRGARLTEQLLAYARKQPLSPEALDLNRFVSEIAGLMERTLGESIEVVTRLAPDLPQAMADSAQLQNALLNLCLNARDALAPAGGRLTLTSGRAWIDEQAATASDLEPGEYLTVTIEDTGSGMSAEVLEQATEPFFSTKEVGQGSGLGLSMAYGFASQTGGGLTIESGPGEGTRVRLFLPRSGDVEGTSPGSADAEAAASTGAKILVLEDDPEVLGYVTACLESMGHAVEKASLGTEALARLRESGSFDLLFTDVMLPGGLSGREVARQAVGLVPGLRVLFTSGYSKDELVHEGRLDPGLELLAKPFRRKDLADAIHRVLGCR